MATTATISMNDREFASLRKIIYDRSGIHFPDNKRYVLEGRLSHRLVDLEMESFDQYIAFLTMGPYQSEEFQELFNRVTINETSFFRNEPQLDAFEKQILPELIEARAATKRLRIWSAPCSSGDEPYTLAIMLHRTLGLRLADWRIEILGTDINEKALEQATAAKYTEYALRSTPGLVKQRYFKQDGTFYNLDPTIRAMAHFELHNLKDKLAAKRFGVWDVIFCRNCMIYFDEAMKSSLLNLFAEQLAPDGRLLIGHSESIRPGEAPFEPLAIPQAFAYRKTGSSRPTL